MLVRKLGGGTIKEKAKSPFMNSIARTFQGNESAVVLAFLLLSRKTFSVAVTGFDSSRYENAIVLACTSHIVTDFGSIVSVELAVRNHPSLHFVWNRHHLVYPHSREVNIQAVRFGLPELMSPADFLRSAHSRLETEIRLQAGREVCHNCLRHVFGRRTCLLSPLNESL